MTNTENQEVDYLSAGINEVEAVSTDFVWPRGNYALKLEEFKQQAGEYPRISMAFLIEDAYDIDGSVDITKLVGKKMMHSISLFTKTAEDLKESLGRVKYAAINCGADETLSEGDLRALLESAVGKTTVHNVYPRKGKDGVTRNDISWTQKKAKEA